MNFNVFLCWSEFYFFYEIFVCIFLVYKEDWSGVDCIYGKM